jgi:hypothetical protein
MATFEPTNVTMDDLFIMDDDITNTTMMPTNNITMMEDDDTMNTSEGGVIVAWSAIWVTALISVLQSVIFYAFFKYQRSQEKRKLSYAWFEPRHFQRAHRSPEPFAESWWKAAWKVEQEELLRCVGLDTYMFLRVLRLGARMAGAGTLCALLLIPVYATGDAEGDATLEFNSLTLAKVEQGSERMWATVVCWWIFVGFVLHEFWTEWTLFSKNRYDFLAKGDPDTPKDFRYAIRVEQLPANLRSSAALVAYFERIFSHQVRQATVYLEISELQKLVQERQVAIETVEKAVAFTKAQPAKETPRTTVGGTGPCGGTKVEVIPHFSTEIERLNSDIRSQRQAILSTANDEQEQEKQEEQEQEKKETCPGISSSTGVVTFTSLRSKQAAIQCEMSGKADNVTVFPAADPKGIIWNNVTVPLSRQRVLGIQAACLWSAGILFWAAPVSFVTSIANLNSILETLGLEQVDPSLFWYGLVAGLLPVIALAILMQVLYMAIVAAGTHWIRFKSFPEVDAYTLRWHQLFQFANLWLILIGGSIFNQLDSLIEDQGSVVEIIAKALPGASIFFVNMISVGGLGNFGMELSCLTTYGVTLVMNMLQPEAMRTQRMLDDAKTPPVILWGQRIPPFVFVFLVTILYMPIVPVVEAFSFVYFGGSYLVWKHQCLHVYSQEFEGGGLTTWESLFGFLMSSLYIGEAVFIAYMGIKEAPAQAGCGFVPLILTILTHMAINRNIRTPLQNLSLEVAADMDITEGELERDPNSSTNVEDQLYAQPSLKIRDEERGPLPYRRSSTETEDVENKGGEEEEASPKLATSEDEEIEVAAPENSSSIKLQLDSILSESRSA